jgi:uncharacterized protein YbjT (DUF2867 family)
MKYVITGGAGHISKPVVEKLIAAGHEVTVIGRSADHLNDLKGKGARTAIGSVENVAFLTNTFKGADAVYTMVPPNLASNDWKAWIAQVGENYAKAIRENNVKYVVNLSSVGAHAPDGMGPVSGLHRAEEALNKLADVNIKHLRPSYFFNNLLSTVGLAKNAGIVGSNFGGEKFTMILADTKDIAEAAEEELLHLRFRGHSVRYIASDERETQEIALVLGKAIGKPGLPWVVFNNNDALNGMLKAGLPEEIARNYAEMGNAIHTGLMFEDYWKHHPEKLGKVKLEDFAKTFAALYNSN